MYDVQLCVADDSARVAGGVCILYVQLCLWVHDSSHRRDISWASYWYVQAVSADHHFLQPQSHQVTYYIDTFLLTAVNCFYAAVYMPVTYYCAYLL